MQCSWVILFKHIIILGMKLKKNQNNDNLKLDNQLCHRVYVFNNKLTRAYRPFLEQINLTYPQYIVMMCLWEKDLINSTELISRTMVNQGSLSLILKKLESKNYIKWISDQSDERSKLVALTTKGRDLRKKAKAVPDSMGELFKKIKKSEFNTVISFLDKLNNDLSESMNEK
jgi:DNA-binding MarR family transcriptional regulator